MKITRYIILSFIAAIILSFSSCSKDDDFHSIKTIERDIFKKINDFRNSNGLSALVEQFLLFERCRSISDKLASGEYQAGGPKAQNDADEITRNLAGTSNALFTLFSENGNADSIFVALTEDSSSRQTLLDEFTQCGVGVSAGSGQLDYVAILLINIPNK